MNARDAKMRHLKAKSRIQEAGKQAFRDGKSDTSSGYKRGPWAYAWLVGWNEARRDAKLDADLAEYARRYAVPPEEVSEK